jgi:uncharacterized damage-inducible protein DinB
MSSNAAATRTSIAETARVADQLHRMYAGPAWHGPSLSEILAGIDEESAARRPIPNAHTIWELVLHITAWIRIGRERLSATQIRDHTDEENWPRMSGSWQDALAMLDREERELESAILSFPAERLDEPAPATDPQTFYILLHGVVQHIAYHAGQIAILKK